MERVPKDHASIGEAAKIPVPDPTRVISISPVILSTPERPVDLQLKIRGSTVGTNLPIILLSHGQGRSNHLNSMNGYDALTNFWAARGFVVIQPTHLSARSLKFDLSTPGFPLFWKSRIQDMTLIIDRLDEIETSVPEFKGRLDRSRIAVAGHSMGAHTSSMLLGATLALPEEDMRVVEMYEPRIKAGVLLSGLGNGGDSLSENGKKMVPFWLHSSFEGMKTPALVVAGDEDVSPHLTVRGWDWHADPFYHAPGAKSLLILRGGRHGLGGISGYDVAETTDESPERAAAVQRLTWAYMRSTLYPDDPAWSSACAALDVIKTLGKVESK